jgi:hypothetical protein
MRIILPERMVVFEEEERLVPVRGEVGLRCGLVLRLICGGRVVEVKEVMDLIPDKDGS